MRICVSGANNMGKSTIIKDFLRDWPNYEEGKISYREKVQQKLGKDTTGTDYRSVTAIGCAQNQEFIRDSMIDDISVYTRDDNVIYDRGLWDNLMYSLYLCGINAPGCTGEWMKDQLPIYKEAFKHYDIIFFTPLLDGYSTPAIPEGNVDLDREVVFRSECDNIFKGLQQNYIDGKREWLPSEDTPAIIELFGTPEERIQMAKLYINEEGSPYGEDNSLIQEHMHEGLEFMQEFEEMHEKTKNQ